MVPSEPLPGGFSSRGVTLKWLLEFCAQHRYHAAERDSDFESLWTNVVQPQLLINAAEHLGKSYVETSGVGDITAEATHCVLHSWDVPLTVVVESLVAYFPPDLHDRVALWMPLFSLGERWLWEPAAYRSALIGTRDFGYDAAAVLDAAVNATAGQVLVLMDSELACFSSWPCMYALAAASKHSRQRRAKAAEPQCSFVMCVDHASEFWQPRRRTDLALRLVDRIDAFTPAELKLSFGEEEWADPAYGKGFPPLQMPPQRVTFNQDVRRAVRQAVHNMGAAALQSPEHTNAHQVALLAAQALVNAGMPQVASSLCSSVKQKMVASSKNRSSHGPVQTCLQLDAEWYESAGLLLGADEVAPGELTNAVQQLQRMLQLMAELPGQYPTPFLAHRSLQTAKLLLQLGDKPGTRQHATRSVRFFEQACVPWQKWVWEWLDHCEIISDAGYYQDAVKLLRGAVSGTLPQGQPRLEEHSDTEQHASALLGRVLTAMGNFAEADDVLGGFIGFQDPYRVRPAAWSSVSAETAWRMAYIRLLLAEGGPQAVALANAHLQRALPVPGDAPRDMQELVAYAELLQESGQQAAALTLLGVAEAFQGQDHPRIPRLQRKLLQSAEGSSNCELRSGVPPAASLLPLPHPLLPAGTDPITAASPAFTRAGVTVRWLRRFGELVRYSRSWADVAQRRGADCHSLDVYHVATVQDVADLFILPATANSGGCYACLPGVSAGVAQVVVCHSRDASFADFVHTLTHRFHDSLDTRVWVDFLCSSQHSPEGNGTGSEADALCTNMIMGAEHVLIVLDAEGRCFRPLAAAYAHVGQHGLWMGDAAQTAAPEVVISERGGRTAYRSGSAWLAIHQVAEVWAEMCAASKQATEDDKQCAALLDFLTHAMSRAVPARADSEPGVCATLLRLLLHSGRGNLLTASLIARAESAAQKLIMLHCRGEALQSPAVSVLHGLIAEAKIAAGDAEGAKHYVQNVVTEDGATPYTAYLRAQLALAEGQPLEAEPLARHAVNQLHEAACSRMDGGIFGAAGPEPPSHKEESALLAIAACLLAQIRSSQEDHSGALDVLCETVYALGWPEGPHVVYLARVQQRCAEALVAQGRPDGAQPHLAAAREIYSLLLGSLHPWSLSLLQLEERCAELSEGMQSLRSGYTAYTTEGVTARWLFEQFYPRVMVVMPGASSDVSTQDVVAAVVKPDTVSRACLYAALPWVPSRPAEYFISHVWRRPFHELMYTLWQRFSANPDAVIWLDIFSFNQHKIMQSEADGLAALQWLEDTVKRVTRRTLVVVDPEAVCFGRAWCLLEHHTAVISSMGFRALRNTNADRSAPCIGKLELLPYLLLRNSSSVEYTAELMGSLRRAVISGTVFSHEEAEPLALRAGDEVEVLTKLQTAVLDLDLEMATAFDLSDKERIVARIAASYGRSNFNATLKKALVRALVTFCQGAVEEPLTSTAMAAQMYSNLGCFSEAQQQLRQCLVWVRMGVKVKWAEFAAYLPGLVLLDLGKVQAAAGAHAAARRDVRKALASLQGLQDQQARELAEDLSLQGCQDEQARQSRWLPHHIAELTGRSMVPRALAVLGAIHLAESEPVPAEQRLRASVTAIAQKLCDRASCDSADSGEGLAAVRTDYATCVMEGRFVQAEALCAAAVAGLDAEQVQQDYLGPDDYFTRRDPEASWGELAGYLSMSLVGLGCVLVLQHQYDTALALLRQGVMLSVASRGGTSQVTADSQIALASASIISPCSRTAHAEATMLHATTKPILDASLADSRPTAVHKLASVISDYLHESASAGLAGQPAEEEAAVDTARNLLPHLPSVLIARELATPVSVEHKDRLKGNNPRWRPGSFLGRALGLLLSNTVVELDCKA